MKASLIWEDETPESYLVCLKEYNLTLEGVSTNDDNTVITVNGEKNAIEQLREDIESGDVLPLCLKRDLSDDEYDEWLADEISKNK